MAKFSAWLAERGKRWPENLWAGTSVTTQNTVTRVLRAALEATGRGRVRLSHRALGHRDLGHAVELDLATPEGERTVRGAYLIGCDGARSAVRMPASSCGPVVMPLRR